MIQSELKFGRQCNTKPENEQHSSNSLSECGHFSFSDDYPNIHLILPAICVQNNLISYSSKPRYWRISCFRHTHRNVLKEFSPLQSCNIHIKLSPEFVENSWRSRGKKTYFWGIERNIAVGIIPLGVKQSSVSGMWFNLLTKKSCFPTKILHFSVTQTCHSEYIEIDL